MSEELVISTTVPYKQMNSQRGAIMLALDKSTPEWGTGAMTQIERAKAMKALSDKREQIKRDLRTDGFSPMAWVRQRKGYFIVCVDAS